MVLDNFWKLLNPDSFIPINNSAASITAAPFNIVAIRMSWPGQSTNETCLQIEIECDGQIECVHIQAPTSDLVNLMKLIHETTGQVNINIKCEMHYVSNNK